ncbi:MAG: hypothetical protein PHR09_03970 [Bacilli bacterium]|nr:hypothetical protein [Bacilli bacterium]
MKAATGETTLTIITIIAIGAVLAFFWIFFNDKKEEAGEVWEPETEQNTTPGTFK